MSGQLTRGEALDAIARRIAWLEDKIYDENARGRSFMRREIEALQIAVRDITYMKDGTCPVCKKSR